MTEEARSVPGGFRSIGVWWTLGAALGALSVVSVVRSVFMNRALVMPLQGTIERHDDALEFLRQLTELFLLPLVQWFGSDLGLQAHWPPVMLLFLILTALTLVEDRRYDGPAVWGLRLAGRLVFAVLAGLALGAVPPGGPWWTQSLAAALPPTIFLFGILISNAAGDAVQGSWQGFLDLLNYRFWRYELAVPFWLIFGLGGAATLLPAFETGAGLAVLGMALIFFGLASLSKGDRYIGLTVLAPFLGAALVYALDWTVRGSGQGLP